MAVDIFPMDPEITNASFVTSDGVHLHALEASPRGMPPGAHRGPVIAFVPGWLMPAAIWHEQLVALGTTHRVAALDPRGQGESEVPGGGYTIARRAQDLHEFTARYPHVVLVAWSLGALETLECVHRYGHDRIDALVLVDSSVGEDPAPPSGSAFRDALKNDRRAAMRAFVRGIFHSQRSASELESLTRTALRMPLEASLSLFPSAVPREHWRGILGSFPKPLMYAVSARFAAQAQALKQRRPATRVEVYAEAGHALFVDEHARFNSMLAQFVTQLS